MIDLKISPALKQVSPGIRLGVIQSIIQYQKENKLLWKEIDRLTYQIRISLSQEKIAYLPVIQQTRQAYLAIGKEPARYRCSAEALLRRLVKGKDLYRINNVVDIINYISLSFHFSIGCYDIHQLTAPVRFDVGREGETYQAIGRGMMNIANLPVFRDQIGPFGSPTSDSDRTMITRKTRGVIILVIDFNGSGPLKEAVEKTLACLRQFAGAKEPQAVILI